MKKLLPLLFLFGMVVASFSYFRPKDEPADRRPSIDDSSKTKLSVVNEPIDNVDMEFATSPSPQLPTSKSSPENIKQEETADSLTNFKKTRATTVANQLGKDLNEILAADGFTQEEIDTAAKYIGDAFLNAGESVALSSAIDAASTILKLDGARKAALSKGIFSAVNAATTRYTYSEYQSCMAFRVAGASDCVKDIAQELTQKVAAKSEADVLNAQAIYSLEPEAKAAVKKAIEACGESSEKAEAYLKVNLSGCL
jgi:hypothetical protein